MAFPVIGSTTVWENWNNFGAGAWNMWFMAPYGSWCYSAFVKSDVTYFKKINIGTSDANYEISDWDFGIVTPSPADVFSAEQDDGFPNGSMGLGCIRGATPKLYLGGRVSTVPTIADAIIHRFLVDDGFIQEDLNSLTPMLGGVVLSVNQLCGIEVDQGNAVYLITNNNSGSLFTLMRYDYAYFDGGAHNPTHFVNMTPQFLENTTASKIRGIGRSSDGHILVFANTGLTTTETRVFKFDKDNLDYLGQTIWSPNISTATWAYMIQHADVFLHFQGLDKTSLYDWKTAVYYDRATGIPDENKSNFIIEDNLTTFGSDTAIELMYEARDAFNIRVPGANTKFVIDGEDPEAENTWTDRVGGIQATPGATFFDGNGIPLAIQTIVPTDVLGVAKAYYKPMRSGTGTARDAINVFCPSDN
jgi:hypothetical protein